MSAEPDSEIKVLIKDDAAIEAWLVEWNISTQ
jgi:hypothetical protein